MIKNYLTYLLHLTTTLALTACGALDSRCGGEYQSFGVDFEVSTISLQQKKAATIQTKVTPESCRGDIRFSVYSGTLPPGMAVESGNVTGTPTTAGTYKFQIGITNVEGYDNLGGSGPARSRQITVTVTP